MYIIIVYTYIFVCVLVFITKGFVVHINALERVESNYVDFRMIHVDTVFSKLCNHNVLVIIKRIAS